MDALEKYAKKREHEEAQKVSARQWAGSKFSQLTQQRIIDAIAEAKGDRDEIPDSDLDDAQPQVLTIKVTLAETRFARARRTRVER